MSFHFFHINEVYSDNTGRVQYIEFVGDDNNQHLWEPHQLLSTDGVNENIFDFPANLPSSATNGRSVLVATQGYADLGLAVPDYIIPEEGFLFQPDGSVIFVDMDQLDYTSLPSDGIMAINGSGETVSNSPLNFTGVNGTIPGIPILGGAFVDTLTGSAENDFIVTLGGNDVAGGGGGNDTIKGGDGKDNLSGGDGSDVLRGGAANDALNGNAGTDQIFGDGGNDTLFYSVGDTFNGGSGTDTVKVNSGNVDLTNIADSKFVSIEQWDLLKGAHTLKLTKSDVLSMSPTDQIKILGDAGDTVNIVGTQVEGATTNGFTRYTIGSAVLLIDADINVT
jgi:serralysin